MVLYFGAGRGPLIRRALSAAKKANGILGQLLRAFTYRDKVTFRGLFLQYVRPILEYAVQSWSPWLQQDIDMLENVQMRAVKAISGLKGTYEEKLAQLELPTLRCNLWH